MNPLARDGTLEQNGWAGQGMNYVHGGKLQQKAANKQMSGKYRGLPGWGLTEDERLSCNAARVYGQQPDPGLQMPAFISAQIWIFAVIFELRKGEFEIQPGTEKNLPVSKGNYLAV